MIFNLNYEYAKKEAIRMLNNTNKSSNHRMIICLLLIVLLFCFCGPILINVLFKLKTTHKFFIAEWGAGDALVYYGSVLTFISTTILSSLAVWQNQMLKKSTDMYNALLISPQIIVKYCGKTVKNSCFTIENKSNNLAKDISICLMNKHKDNDHMEITIECLGQNEHFQFDYDNAFFGQNSYAYLNVLYKDISGNQYTQSFKCNIDNNQRL